MSIAKLLSVIEQILTFPLFDINRTKVTLSSLVMVGLVMVGFMLVSRFMIKSLFAGLLLRTKLDAGTQYTFTRIAHYIVLIMGAIIAFQFVGIDLSGLIVIFGFLSLGIGFGLQNVTSNFISGIILLLERPIQVGDRVVVGDTEGDIQEIHLRSTIVRTLNNVSIIVPNSEFISSNVINWSYVDPKVRIEIPIGVSYDSDLDLVLNTLREIAEENNEVLKDPEPEVLFEAFGDSAWDLNLRVWIGDPKRHQQLRSDINCAIVRKFRANNIQIPFPQRDLHVRSPLPLPISSGHEN